MILGSENPLAGLRRVWNAAVLLADERHEGPGAGSPREIHFLRLTVKRLRSYLQLVRTELPPADFESEDRFLRDIAVSLAGRRDFIVALRTLKRLKHSAKGKAERRALLQVRRLLEESEIEETHAPAESARRATARAVALLHESRERIELALPRTAEWDLLDAGAGRTHSRALKRFRKWVRSDDAREAHGCRKCVKQLGFQLELLGTNRLAKIERIAERLEKLQKSLGKLNDLTVIEHRLDEMTETGLLGRKTGKRARRAIKRSRKKVARACRAAGRKALVPGSLPAGLFSGFPAKERT